MKYIYIYLFSGESYIDHRRHRHPEAERATALHREPARALAQRQQERQPRGVRAPQGQHPPPGCASWPWCTGSVLSSFVVYRRRCVTRRGSWRARGGGGAARRGRRAGARWRCWSAGCAACCAPATRSASSASRISSRYPSRCCYLYDCPIWLCKERL